jgi:hypothetical protein
MNTTLNAPVIAVIEQAEAQISELPLDVLALIGGGEGTVTPY